MDECSVVALECTPDRNLLLMNSSASKMKRSILCTSVFVCFLLLLFVFCLGGKCLFCEGGKYLFMRGGQEKQEYSTFSFSSKLSFSSKHL